MKKCELFDGFTVEATFKTKKSRWDAELGLYNGRPTVVGGNDRRGSVETLDENGWISLQAHPK